MPDDTANKELHLPEHDCEPLYDFTKYMEDGREWWIGRITSDIEGYEHEKWCWHITTPEKPEIVFGFNGGDIEYLFTMARAILFRERGWDGVNEDWLESVTDTAEKKAND